MPEKLQEAAERQLHIIDETVKTSLKASLKWPKRLIVMLIVTCAMLLGATGFMSYLYIQQRSLVHTVQEGAISGCQQGNAQRMTDEQNWDYFIDKLLQHDTRPKDIAEGIVIKRHIAEADAPRDCATEYGK